MKNLLNIVCFNIFILGNVFFDLALNSCEFSLGNLFQPNLLMAGLFN